MPLDHRPHSSSFKLIETMYFRHRIRFLDDHLDRLTASAAFFNIPVDRSVIQEEISLLLSDVEVDASYKVRLTLDLDGELSITKNSISREKPENRTVCISPIRVDASDVFFYHKTTRRALYESEYERVKGAGYYEVLFLNNDGFLTEGSRNNLFVKSGIDVITPPQNNGLLGGIYRQQLLKRCKGTFEKELMPDDLQPPASLYLCNAVRGLRKVMLSH